MLDHDAEHNQTEELMAGYALGTITPEERQLVESHTARCQPCLDELLQFKAVAGVLPEGIVMMDPPPDLKNRIMARAHSSAAARNHSNVQSTGLLAGDRQGLHSTPPAASARATPQPAAPHPPSAWERFLESFRSLSPALSMAGLALLVVLGIVSGFLWASRVLNQNESTLRTIALRGVGSNPQAVGTLVISLDGEHGTLVVDALPVLDEAHEYQLWLTKGGQTVSGGIFSVDEEGYGAKWASTPEALASYERATVTIEPAGGSPQPTGEQVLSGDL